MALAVANRKTVGGGTGDLTFATADITLDNAYPTGGWPGIASLLGFTTLFALVDQDCAGFQIGYRQATDQLRVFDQPAAAAAGASPEAAANLAALNGIVIHVLAIGQVS